MRRAGPCAVLAFIVLAVMRPLVGQQSIPFRANELRRLVGTNLNWVWDGDGLRLSRAGEPSGLTDSLIRSLAYTALRIPGGTLARRFDWRLAVDTPRGRDADYSGKAQAISTGLPELKRFATRYRLQVLYTLNINDSPAKVVELMDRWNRLPPLGEAPIRYVELGNEDYITNGLAKGAEQYSDVVLPIIRSLRASRPEIKIGAQLANPLGTGWDEVVYRRLGDKVDFWTWHRYLPYTTYDSSRAYQQVTDAILAFDRDFQRRDAMQTGRRLPIWLTEYNFMFYRGAQYENIALQPRYYLLLGDFLYVAVKHGVAAMFRWCLSNPGWLALADIDYAGTGRVDLSLTGQVSGLLNRWVVRQDSVALMPEPVSSSQRSVLAGKDSTGTLSFLVQNHDPQGLTVRLPVPAGYGWDSSEELFASGPAFSADRPRPVSGASGSALSVAPYSITIVRFRPVPP